MTDRAVTVRDLVADDQFRRFLLSRILSNVGSIATYIALPVLVYRSSGSAGLTALVAACEAAPYLLLGLFSGALTDRWNRKRVMVAADVASTLLLATIPVAHVLGHVTVAHVLVVAFLGPAISVFFDGAVFGAIPVLVGRDGIAVANSLTWSIQSLIEIVVPSVVGVLLAFVDPSWLLGADAVTFAASATCLAAITRPMYDASRARARLSARGIAADIAEGLRYLWHHEGVRTMTLVGTIQCVCGGGFMALYVVWIDQVLGLGTQGVRFGLVFAAWSLGSLAASIALPRLVRRVTPARVALVAMPFSAVLGIAVTLVTSWWLAALGMVAWSVAYTLVAVNSITYRQQVTPEHLLGRVNTAGRMLSWGVGWTGGTLLAGVVVGAVGLRPTLTAFAAVALVGVVVAWTSPLRVRTAVGVNGVNGVGGVDGAGDAPSYAGAPPGELRASPGVDG